MLPHHRPKSNRNSHLWSDISKTQGRVSNTPLYRAVVATTCCYIEGWLTMFPSVLTTENPWLTCYCHIPSVWGTCSLCCWGPDPLVPRRSSTVMRELRQSRRKGVLGKEFVPRGRTNSFNEEVVHRKVTRAVVLNLWVLTLSQGCTSCIPLLRSLH